MTKLKQCTITIPNRNAHLFSRFFDSNDVKRYVESIGCPPLTVMSESQGDSGTKFTYTFPDFTVRFKGGNGSFDNSRIVGYTTLGMKHSMYDFNYNIFSTLPDGDQGFFDYKTINDIPAFDCLFCSEYKDQSNGLFILEKDGFRFIAHPECVAQHTHHSHGVIAFKLYKFFALDYYNAGIGNKAMDSKNSSYCNTRKIDKNGFYNEDNSLLMAFKKSLALELAPNKVGRHNPLLMGNAFTLCHHPHDIISDPDIEYQAKNIMFKHLKEKGVDTSFYLNDSIPVSPEDISKSVADYVKDINEKLSPADINSGWKINNIEGFHPEKKSRISGKVVSVTHTFINLKKASRIKLEISDNDIIEIQGHGFPYDIVEENDVMTFIGHLKETRKDEHINIHAFEVLIPKSLRRHSDDGIYGVSGTITLG